MTAFKRCSVFMVFMCFSLAIQASPVPFLQDEIRIQFNTSPGTTTSTDSGEQFADQIVVVRGDNLSKLAARHLGSGARWRDLVAWNADRYPSLMKNPHLIHPGWVLRLGPPRKGESSIPPAAPGTSPSAQVSMAGNLINSNTRVLHIGDSHTVGAYGQAMDQLMRDTGAKVSTYGVSGASPGWWLNGTTGRSGYRFVDENGRIQAPADWRTPVQTPKLTDLLNQHQPDVVVISLGANLLRASPAQIRDQVRRLSEAASARGAKIVWIGPPNGREDKKPTQLQNQLYENIQAVASEYGTFVDSRPHTTYPATGGDGAHYGGTEGTRIARDWASEVFSELQRSGPAATVEQTSDVEPAPRQLSVGGRITSKSPQFSAWFDEAARIAQNWDFPNVTNMYGKKITPEDYLRAVIFIESRGVQQKSNSQTITSRAGALGFMQLMPNTARSLGVNPHDPAQNLRGGSTYLGRIFNRGKVSSKPDLDKLIMAGCAYNIGPNSRRLDQPWSSFVTDTSAPKETRRYGLRIKMCLGLPLSAEEQRVARELMVPRTKTVEQFARETYAYAQGIGR